MTPLARRVMAGAQHAMALLITLSVLSAGCKSTVRTTAPIPVRMSVEEARAEFGTLAVATVERTPAISFDRPETSRGKAAKEGVKAGLAGALMLIAGSFEVPPLTFIGLPVGLAFLPFSPAVGAIEGALAAQSPEDVARAVSTLEAASREANIQQRLRDLVIAHLSGEHYGVAPINEGNGHKTVVEVSIDHVSLNGPGINPTLTLFLPCTMRLLREGIEIRNVTLVFCTGEGRTLLAWADDDAKSFKEGIAYGLEKLAGGVVSNLLSRPAQRPVPDTVDPRGPTAK